MDSGDETAAEERDMDGTGHRCGAPVTGQPYECTLDSLSWPGRDVHS